MLYSNLFISCLCYCYPTLSYIYQIPQCITIIVWYNKYLFRFTHFFLNLPFFCFSFCPVLKDHFLSGQPTHFKKILTFFFPSVFLIVFRSFSIANDRSRSGNQWLFFTELTFSIVEF